MVAEDYGIGIQVSNDLLIVDFKDKKRVDLEDAKNILSYRNSTREGNIYPQLVIMGELQSISREAFKFWGQEAGNGISANAIVTPNAISKMLYNVFTLFFRSEVPLKAFENKEAAKAWLSRYKPSN